MSTLNMFVATVYGGALDVAEQVQPLFEQAGYTVTIHEDPPMESITSGRADLSLFCISTTGSGDIPGNLLPFVEAIRDQHPDLSGLRYGLIALGDSSYAETFCGAGRSLDALLGDCGARRIGDRLEIDAMETFMADDAALPWVEQWIDSL